MDAAGATALAARVERLEAAVLVLVETLEQVVPAIGVRAGADPAGLLPAVAELERLRRELAAPPPVAKGDGAAGGAVPRRRRWLRRVRDGAEGGREGRR